jgi:hypothetical protein
VRWATRLIPFAEAGCVGFATYVVIKRVCSTCLSRAGLVPLDESLLLKPLRRADLVTLQLTISSIRSTGPRQPSRSSSSTPSSLS